MLTIHHCSVEHDSNSRRLDPSSDGFAAEMARIASGWISEAEWRRNRLHRPLTHLVVSCSYIDFMGCQLFIGVTGGWQFS